MNGKKIKIIILTAVCVLAAVSVLLFTLKDGTQVQDEPRTEILSVPPAESAPEPVSEPADYYAGTLRITELMVKNKSYRMMGSGVFPDWVELENISSAEVDLSGWSLGKNGDKACPVLDAVVLQPGEFAVVWISREDIGAVCRAELSIGPEDTLALITPMGSRCDSVYCFEDDANLSIALNESGEFETCSLPTPGYANTPENYDAVCETETYSGPLIINEIMGGNLNSVKCNTGYEDWIEIKNISKDPVNLHDYYLSDDAGDRHLWQFPEKTLKPGGIFVVWCSALPSYSNSGTTHKSFKLDSENETVYLSSETEIIDYAAYHDVMIGGSMGRLKNRNGWFLFSSPTPKKDNKAGCRRRADKPECLTPDGVYDGVESVSVELKSGGVVYYTLDGSEPTKKSRVYSEPITLTETGIVKAIAVEEGLETSRTLVLSYIINENHTLPVLSLVLNDYDAFISTYESTDSKVYGPKAIFPGSLSLYEDGNVFTRACGAYLKGRYSLILDKKSLGVSFSGKYGDGMLKCDVFGNGIDEYKKLSLRVGQDYPLSIFRNELMQEMCLAATDNVPTQESKYCILYLNGNYRGIYCLKEDVNRPFYASHNGVSKSDVRVGWAPARASSDFYREVIAWCDSHDLSEAENYEYFCSVFDTDNLVDWIIMEGWCSNPDINANMRYFKTDGGKWQIVFYDLDWTFRDASSPFSNVLESDKAQVCYRIIRPLMTNEAFREKLARRAAELLSTELSNESVLAEIDRLELLLEPEVERERALWGGTVDEWHVRVDGLRRFITENDWDSACLKHVLSYCMVSEELSEELEAYMR